MIEASFGSIELGLKRADSAASSPSARSAFRILVLANFSGGSGTATPIAQRRIERLDRDNEDAVFARMQVQLALGAKAGEPLALDFAELDDLHPDRWIERLAIFDELRGLQRRLAHPKSFEAAAAQLLGPEVSPASGAPAAAGDAKGEAAPDAGGGFLAAALEATPAREARGASRSGSSLIDALAAELARPFVLPAQGERQAACLAEVERRRGQLTRRILADPAMRSLESAWLGVHALLRRLETDGALSLSLFDLRRDELESDLFAQPELTRSQVYKKLVEAREQEPWTLVLIDADLGDAQRDAQLLGRMARLAGVGGFLVLAGASPRLFGCESFGASADPDDWTRPVDEDGAAAWAALRALPEAGRIALAAPRFLLRSPYGAKGTRLESFAFEEALDASAHEAYPWGNGAFALACALANDFTQAGADWSGEQLFELDRLPTHVRELDGEAQLLPCAEAWLSSRAAEAIVARGVSALRSIKERDAIQFGPIRALDGSQIAG